MIIRTTPVVAPGGLIGAPGVSAEKRQQIWRLNARMYEGLTGLDEMEAVVKHGAEQVQIWCRSLDLPPPEIEAYSQYHPKLEAKYNALAEDKSLRPRAWRQSSSESCLSGRP